MRNKFSAFPSHAQRRRSAVRAVALVAALGIFGAAAATSSATGRASAALTADGKIPLPVVTATSPSSNVVTLAFTFDPDAKYYDAYEGTTWVGGTRSSGLVKIQNVKTGMHTYTLFGGNDTKKLYSPKATVTVTVGTVVTTVDGRITQPIVTAANTAAGEVTLTFAYDADAQYYDVYENNVWTGGTHTTGIVKLTNVTVGSHTYMVLGGNDTKGLYVKSALVTVNVVSGAPTSTVPSTTTSTSTLPATTTTAPQTTTTMPTTTTTPPTTTTTVPAPGGYGYDANGVPLPAASAGFTKLAMNEDFTSKLTDAKSGVQGFVDPAKWRSGYQWGYRASPGEFAGVPTGATTLTTNASNQNVNQYTWQQAQQPGDGTLHLVAQKAPANFTDGMGHTVPQGNWISGMIESPDNFSFRYGFVEASIKNPAGKGLWSALWMCQKGDPLVWPPEVDIMEVEQHDGLNNRDTNNVWWGTGTQDPTMVTLATPNAFNTYSLRWTPTEMDWYVNKVLVKTFTNASQIPAAAMYILANLAVGGSSGYGGSPDSTTPNPATMQIDYIRTWTAQ